MDSPYHGPIYLQDLHGPRLVHASPKVTCNPRKLDQFEPLITSKLWLKKSSLLSLPVLLICVATVGLSELTAAVQQLEVVVLGLPVAQAKGGISSPGKNKFHGKTWKSLGGNS